MVQPRTEPRLCQEGAMAFSRCCSWLNLPRVWRLRNRGSQRSCPLGPAQLRGCRLVGAKPTSNTLFPHFLLVLFSRSTADEGPERKTRCVAPQTPSIVAELASKTTLPLQSQRAGLHHVQVLTNHTRSFIVRPPGLSAIA